MIFTTACLVLACVASIARAVEPQEPRSRGASVVASAPDDMIQIGAPETPIAPPHPIEIVPGADPEAVALWWLEKFGKELPLHHAGRDGGNPGENAPDMDTAALVEFFGQAI